MDHTEREDAFHNAVEYLGEVMELRRYPWPHEQVMLIHYACEATGEELDFTLGLAERVRKVQDAAPELEHLPYSEQFLGVLREATGEFKPTTTYGQLLNHILCSCRDGLAKKLDS